MQQFPPSFVLRDEIYQMTNYSRDKVRVLMRLDVSKLDMRNKNVHRTDGDFAVTWAKMYGKGRVFYTSLGHVEENWDKPEFQQMITAAIQWAMKLRDADVTSRPLPRNSGIDELEFDHQTQLRQDSRRRHCRNGDSFAGVHQAQHRHRHLQLSQSFAGRNDRPVEGAEGRCDRNVARRVHVDESSDRGTVSFSPQPV